jgi:hypothetical protein
VSASSYWGWDFFWDFFYDFFWDFFYDFFSSSSTISSGHILYI